MADPKQLRVLKALTTHLEGIDPENDDPHTEEPYGYSLQGKVFRGRTTLGQDVIMPALSILESPNPKNGKPAGHNRVKRLEDWELLVQGFAMDDRANPTDPAYVFKAQVEMRLARLIEIVESNGNPRFPEEYLLDKLITGMTIGQGVVRPPTEKVSPTAFFYIPLVVELTTDVSNPYAD